MFEPIIFPNTTSWAPLAPDIKFTTNSGAEVPIATTVSPMAISEALNLFASDEAPLTRKSAPFINKTNPTLINNMLIAISNFLLVYGWY
jgi:hypothetical protein